MVQPRNRTEQPDDEGVSLKKPKNIRSLLKFDIGSNLERFRKTVVPCFRNTMIRVEGYFEFQKSKEFLTHIQKSLLSVPQRKITFKYAREEDVCRFATILLDSADFFVHYNYMSSFSALYSTLEMYKQVVSGLFGVFKLSKRSVETSRGIGLCQELFSKDMTLSLKAMMDLEESWFNCFDKILGGKGKAENAKLLKLQMRLEHFYEIINICEDMETQKLSSKISQFVAQNVDIFMMTSSNDAERTVFIDCLENYILEILPRVRKDLNFLVLQSLLAICKISEVSFRILTATIQNRQLVFCFRNYCIHYDPMVKQSTLQLREYVQEICLSTMTYEIGQYFQGNSSKCSVPIQEYGKLLLQAEKKAFTEDSKLYNCRFRDFDAYARFVLVFFPIDDKWIQILDVFAKISDFVDFLVIALKIGYTNGRTDKKLGKARDNLTKRLLHKIKVGQLLVCSGVFGLKNKPDIILLPIPERCDITRVIPASGRPRLLHSSIGNMSKKDSSRTLLELESFLQQDKRFLFDDSFFLSNYELIDTDNTKIQKQLDEHCDLVGIDSEFFDLKSAYLNIEECSEQIPPSGFTNLPVALQEASPFLMAEFLSPPPSNVIEKHHESEDEIKSIKKSKLIPLLSKDEVKVVI